MKKQLKTKKELFDYLMYAYVYELEDVSTKKGIQKRLKDNDLEKELKNKVKESITIKDIHVELKLGRAYNRKESPWIQLYTTENKSGTKGRYVGISFLKETNEIDIWVGFGKDNKKQSEIIVQSKKYKIKYSLIEPNLKYGFEYKAECNDAIFINKKININNFKEEEFERDIEYITNLYKAYEIRYENALILSSDDTEQKTLIKNTIDYEEINRRMLTLIEEVGNLAKAIKELKNE